MRMSIVAAAAAFMVVGCDIADRVPHVEDPQKNVVNGQPMTQMAFVEKYCTGETTNENCVKVRGAMVAGAGKSAPGPVRF